MGTFTGTWEEWTKLPLNEQQRLKDLSDLNLALIGYEGKRVRVTPKRQNGRSTFVVGRSTGWKPVHLAVRKGAMGSSDIVSAEERIDSVQVLGWAS